MGYLSSIPSTYCWHIEWPRRLGSAPKSSLVKVHNVVIQVLASSIIHLWKTLSIAIGVPNRFHHANGDHHTIIPPYSIFVYTSVCTVNANAIREKTPTSPVQTVCMYPEQGDKSFDHQCRIFPINYYYYYCYCVFASMCWWRFTRVYHQQTNISVSFVNLSRRTVVTAAVVVAATVALTVPLAAAVSPMPFLTTHDRIHAGCTHVTVTSAQVNLNPLRRGFESCSYFKQAAGTHIYWMN